MDIAVTPKSSNKIPKLIMAVLVGGAALWGLNFLWSLSQAQHSVSRDTITVGQVRQGAFIVSVRGNGVLVPDTVQWLSASVDAAKVERVLVKPGNEVKQGDLIVELSNPQLVKRLAEQRWEIEAMVAEAQAAKVSDESELLAQRSAVLDARLNYESSQLKHQAESHLMRESNGAVSRLTFEQTKLETHQFKQRWEISEQRLTKMQENLVAQENARIARQQKAQKLLESLQQQVNDLKVTAAMDSIILEVPLEPGQRVVMGSNIAKLAQQGSLIAELQVPEIQINNVAVGQQVQLDTRNTLVSGVVQRVDPAVVGGNVQVDVALLDELPAEARPDLSVFGEIQITNIDDALFVERPLYAQSQSRAAFYKLTADGAYAERVELSLGLGSVDQIQVLAGLEPGDRIITSDPSAFEQYRKFRIN